MMHSSPKPLKVAIDIAKRLNQDLARHLTPEQRRDFARVERLIDEAERNHLLEITRLHQRLSSPASGAAASAAAPTPARRRFWQ